MGYSTTCKYTTKKARQNIVRVLLAFQQARTAKQAADLLCMTQLAVCRYLHHINSESKRINIVGNAGRAPIYKTEDQEC